MTIDTYTVTGSQIETVTGKAFNANENDLLRSIPSVTIDKTGTVSIRGGFAFEAAYEFEGIDYTTPSANLQNTLQNVANFNLLNGVGSVQLIPGGGDATHGDTGTGLVLFTAKHGTYPSYLHVDAESQLFPYLHQLGLEWGWADPSQRLSNYAGFIGIRKAYQYGIPGTAANTLGTLGTNAATLGSTIDPNLVYYAPSFLKSNDFVDNLIYRFGRNREPAAAVLHPGPVDHADARLRRFSVSAVHLGRHDVGQMRALSGHRLQRHPGQLPDAELRLRLADPALSRPAQHLRLRLVSPTRSRARSSRISSSTA